MLRDGLLRAVLRMGGRRALGEDVRLHGGAFCAAASRQLEPTRIITKQALFEIQPGPSTP
jgi:hypothetical protein